MVSAKGLIGTLDGYFPWGSLQAVVKGATFGFGQALGLGFLEEYTTLPVRNFCNFSKCRETHTC